MAYTWEDLMKMQGRQGATATEMTPPAPGTLTNTPIPDAPINTQGIAGGDDADVEDSKFVNFARLWNGNREKAGQSAARAAKKASDAEDSFSKDAEKATGDFYSGLKGNQATPYSGEAVSSGDTSGGTVNKKQSNGTTLQTKTQGLEGTPVAGAITPAEAQARASQVYGGPTGIAGYETLMQRAAPLEDEAAALTTQEGREGLLSSQDGSALGSKGAQLDAALTGVAGGARFQQLNDRFAGAGKRLTAAQKKAQALAANEAGEFTDANTQYQGAIDRHAADVATQTASNEARQKGADAFVSNASVPKSGVEWEDIPAGTIGNGNFKDYAYGIWGTGVSAADSEKYGKQVWNSMTAKEVSAFQFGGMTANEKYAFIINRAKALGIEGTENLKVAGADRKM